MNYHTLKIAYFGVVCSTTLTGFFYGLYKLFECRVGRISFGNYSSSAGIQDTVGIVGMCTFLGFAGGVTFPVLVPILLTAFLYTKFQCNENKKFNEIQKFLEKNKYVATSD